MVPYNLVDFLNAKHVVGSSPAPGSLPCGIPEAKKRGIVHVLRQYMSENRRVFWQQISTDVSDLIDNDH